MTNLLIQLTDQMKAIIQNLYNMIVQAHDHQGTSTENAMREQTFVFSSLYRRPER